MNRLVGILLILLIITLASVASLGYLLTTSRTQTITESYTTTYTKTVSTMEIFTNGSSYQVITIVKEYVVMLVQVASLYEYGTCSAQLSGTAGILDTTVSTTSLAYGEVTQNAQYAVVIVTTTTTTAPHERTEITTIYVNTTVSPCPAIS